jgi:hypothetical protein
MKPTEKPESKPWSIDAFNILLRASITTTNSRRERGSPCLIPREI